MTAKTESPLIPLDIRLRTIEAQVYGLPSSFSENSSKRSETSNKSVIRQIRESQETFDRLSNESEGIKRLIQGYDHYLPLLNLSTVLPGTTSTFTDNHDIKENDNKDKPITESDLLNDQVKLNMILESATDLKQSERILREIDLLKQKNVEGSGQLEKLLPYNKDLTNAIKKQQIHSTELSKVENDVRGLLNRYNQFTTTTSELFIDIHHNLQYLEDRVDKLERKKRKEIENRY
ncbi:uncharacterized protein I206_106202 [Kwoniella pini CBS 10737]|uniref:Uncharacterized protein n=1 Tax=Kwoniella pini CBS 10737 TaxID=1296096 RepID=A0A1B9I1B6_9TREE|nr:uncharacterized protein I206_05027 [Kwoniella pini CBS 10737]OCF49336.1 hypothetical protein I206_05027 [Kwoniella pini CBS 10737]